MFAVDADGDNDVDVLVASSDDARITWYLNDGAEHFTVQDIDNDAYGASSAHAADLDGHNDIDVVAVAPWSDSISWYEQVAP